MRLIFKTANGSITMSGKPDTQYVIKSVSGLGIPERNYECISYYGSDGKTTLSSYFGSRIITISGDIYNYSSHIKKKTSKILYAEGQLITVDGYSKKAICYKPLKLEYGETYGSIQSFAFQIECDNPYFQDLFFTKKNIYTRKDNITSPFTLPAVFSERNSITTIVNKGDEKIFPIIIIQPKTDDDATGIYTIKNLTTGACLVLDLICENKEKITVDISGRTLTSSIKGNIVNCLSDGAMSEFFLAPGENIIECLCSNTSVSPHSTVMYKTNYMEAL